MLRYPLSCLRHHSKHFRRRLRWQVGKIEAEGCKMPNVARFCDSQIRANQSAHEVHLLRRKIDAIIQQIFTTQKTLKRDKLKEGALKYERLYDLKNEAANLLKRFCNFYARLHSIANIIVWRRRYLALHVAQRAAHLRTLAFDLPKRLGGRIEAKSQRLNGEEEAFGRKFRIVGCER